MFKALPTKSKPSSLSSNRKVSCLALAEGAPKPRLDCTKLSTDRSTALSLSSCHPSCASYRSYRAWLLSSSWCAGQGMLMHTKFIMPMMCLCPRFCPLVLSTDFPCTFSPFPCNFLLSGKPVQVKHGSFSRNTVWSDWCLCLGVKRVSTSSWVIAPAPLACVTCLARNVNGSAWVRMTCKCNSESINTARSHHNDATVLIACYAVATIYTGSFVLSASPSGQTKSCRPRSIVKPQESWDTHSCWHRETVAIWPHWANSEARNKTHQNDQRRCSLTSYESYWILAFQAVLTNCLDQVESFEVPRLSSASSSSSCQELSCAIEQLHLTLGCWPTSSSLPPMHPVKQRQGKRVALSCLL